MVTDGGTRGREAVEAVLHTLAKRWQFLHGAPTGDGGQALEYSVRLKKSTQPTAFLDAVRALGGAGVRQADLK